MKKFGRPWWEVRTRTVRQAYVLGGLLLLIGGFQLALVPGAGFLMKWVHLATGTVFILLAVAYLASGVRLRRRASVAGSESLTSALDAEQTAEIDSLLTRGKVIRAVRRVRELTGMDLVDAKRLVDSLKRQAA